MWKSSILTSLMLLAAGAAPRQSDGNAAALYAAVLRGYLSRGMSRPALDPRLMSDSGTYEPHGWLAPAVRDSLVRMGAVSEICDVRADASGDDCATKSAGWAVQFSAPRWIGQDTVRVYLGRRALPRPGRLFLGYASTHRCDVARQARGWKLVRCLQTMVT